VAHQQQDWKAQLAAVSPEIHISFSLQRQKYWLAEWSSNGARHHLYIGMTSPESHPCFGRDCGHPRAKAGPKPGYQPGAQTIQRLRDAHTGKRLSEHHRKALREAKHRRDRAIGYVPPYRQIAEHFKEQIQQGQWKTWQQLPSLVEAAKQFGVDEATMSRAYRVLAEERLVAIQPSQGTFVR
jgi:hypothetical protein